MKTIAQQLNVKEFPFRIWDGKGREIYYETSTGYWAKREYNSKGTQIYYENSDGVTVIHCPKEVTVTMDEIAAKFNIPVSQLKIKK